MKKHEIFAITSALITAQAAGKVEAPKTPEKSRFRPVLKRRHDALPGEVRELETSAGFRELCALHEIPCTHRQASKYLQKRGRLYTATR